jgi:hypothetical protein
MAMHAAACSLTLSTLPAIIAAAFSIVLVENQIAESALGGIARDALSATCRTFGSVRMQIIWPGSGDHAGDGHR